MTRRGLIQQAFFFAGQGGNKLPVYEVCDALNRRTELHERLIQIQGLLVSTEEGASLRSARCHKKIAIDGIEWIPQIHLEFSPAEVGDLRDSKDEVLEAPFRQAMEMAAKKTPKPTALEVVYLGRFLTRARFYPYQAQWGTMGNGFGHLAMFPASLVVKRVTGVRFLTERRK